MKWNSIIITTIGALILFSSCEEIPTTFVTEDNYISIADFLYENTDDFSSFISVMEAGKLKDALSAYNPNGSDYTLFLPSNQAFDDYISANSDYSDVNSLLADTDFVRALSRYHVVNSAVESNDFPLGALPDSSLTGDYLIIAYIYGEDSTYFKINGQALVRSKDLQMTNGVVHVIDQVLEPITKTGYDWVRTNPDYTIFADLLDLTEVRDTMGQYTTDSEGRVIPNYYSMLVEADSIFNKQGISSLNDLVTNYSGGMTDYTNKLNPLNQFAAYHILPESRFLSDLYDGSNNYNTFAALPVQITMGLDIRINKGVSKFDSIFSQADSAYTYIDYIEILVNESNIQTRNGPVHLINRVMELYEPERTRLQFEFYEEPAINIVRNEEREFFFNKLDNFTTITWSGTEEIIWKKGSTDEKADHDDYLEIDGDFLISYELPKVYTGRYEFQIRVNTARSENATIQVFLDGKQVGGNMNLTTGGANSSNPYRVLTLGIVEFGKYEEHNVSIRSLIPGKLTWDWVRFDIEDN